MVIDWRVVYSLKCEFESKLTGARVDKIYQTSASDVYLRLRGFGAGFTVFLSCDPSMPRAHLAERVPERADAPPMFCMLLRKHLANARLLNVEQPNFDRILKFDFEGTDALGDKFTCSLILEIMGRHSNLILVRDGKILGAARQTGDFTAKRPIMTGLAYTLPEQKSANSKDSELGETIQGISAIIEREFADKSEKARNVALGAGLETLIRNNMKKLARKIDKLKREFEIARDREGFKLYGELITANIYLDVADEIEVLNYYTNEKIKIPLDSTISMAKNAERYYKKYNKCKRAEQELSRQIEIAEREIAWFESVQDALGRAKTREDVDEIAEELSSEGCRVRTQRTNKKTRKNTAVLPIKNVDGFDIYVGKNNTQNDFLSLKFACGDDLWLHVQEMPSSHVLVRAEGRNVPENVILAGAELAARNSRARGKVTVDYCMAKNVKKPRGGKPGFVIYREFSSVIVNCD